jgi:hypothetical protein
MRSAAVPPSPSAVRVPRWVSGGVWLIAVALLTLIPNQFEADRIARLTWSCLFCGDRGVSDAILNVCLFVPLGLVLQSRRRPVVMALLVGLGISILIESAQLILPGRHSSLADLVWNATGAGVGAALLVPIGARVAGTSRGLGIAVGAGVALLFCAAGYLVTPHFTDEPYWGQWTPDLGWMPQYEGEVLSAELNGRAFWSRRLEMPMPHRDLFLGEWKLEGEIVVGAPPEGVSPILSVYDGNQQEILLLGAHDQALVFRPRLVARRLGLDAPDIRIIDAFQTFSAGDTVTISAAVSGEDVCLRLGPTERCEVGITPGRTWGLLLYLEGPPEDVRVIIDLLWVAMLFALIGLAARSRAEVSWGGSIGGAGLAVSVAFTPLIAVTAPQLVAGVLGLLSGRAVGRWLEWYLRPAP